ncbi:hypothetical protein ACQP1O_12665 [Nocardia sp. CA-151230]|uniref:hypothetical protein n=1 Tax=Nocardia sp. CA-151230 TaxID=3239982 RepID=UPI003D94C343
MTWITSRTASARRTDHQGNGTAMLGFLWNEHYASLSGVGTAAMAQLPTAEFP